MGEGPPLQKMTSPVIADLCPRATGCQLSDHGAGPFAVLCLSFRIRKMGMLVALISLSYDGGSQWGVTLPPPRKHLAVSGDTFDGHREERALGPSRVGLWGAAEQRAVHATAPQTYSTGPRCQEAPRASSSLG